MKKLICFVLAALLLTTPLTACIGGEGNNTDTESESVSVSESETEKETAPETPNPIDLCRLGGVPISEFSIVVSADMPSVQAATVEELIKHTAAATGVTLSKITSEQTAAHEIVIGNGVRENAKVAAAVAEIKNDGYAIVMDEGDLYISASTGRGVVYGMYDFMENYLGVHYYAADCITYDEANIVDIPADLKDVYSPAFAYRGGNARRVWEYFGKPASKVNTGDMTEYGDNVSLTMMSNHLIHDFCGTGQGYIVPDPCLTDEAHYQHALQMCLKEIDASTLPAILQIGTADAHGHCTCENCTPLYEQYGSTSATFMLFVNRLAKEIKELRPDAGAQINTYAYHDTTKPPKGMVMEDNVMVNYCMMEACFSHAFNDPNCPKNVEVAKDLAGWCEIAENVSIYDYHHTFSAAQNIDPNLYVLLENARWLAEIGLDGYGGEQWHPDEWAGDFEELRSYLIWQVTWDPYMTEEEYLGHMNGFLEAYYGEAAPLMKEYIDKTTQNSFTPGYWYDQGEVKEYSGCTATYAPAQPFFLAYNEDGSKNLDFTNEMWTLWEEALSLDLTDEQRAHVERASGHFYAWVVGFSNDRTQIRKAAEKVNEYKAKYNICIN